MYKRPLNETISLFIYPIILWSITLFLILLIVVIESKQMSDIKTLREELVNTIDLNKSILEQGKQRDLNIDRIIKHFNINKD